MKPCAFAIVLLFGAVALCSAEEINENELFSSPDMITAAPDAPAPAEKTGTAFSAQFNSVMQDTVISTAAKSSQNSYILANGFIDARLKNGMKAFANIETSYTPSSKATTVDLRELFFDFNFDRQVYLRTGKQVLQWGRCMLWNPTDLVNVEKKTFIRQIGYREGAYGLKLHVPFGASRNIYSFLDTGNAPSPDDLGGAVKYEFLVGRTEMAFSGWTKASYHPVLGYDLSTRWGDVDILGEASVSKGDNVRRIREDRGVLSVWRNDEDWTPRASVNFSKGFRLGEFNDRMTIATEFFYNHGGYDNGLFADQQVYPFAAPITVQNAAGAQVPVPAGTRRDYLLLNNLYDPNYFSRYYGALFTSIGRFLITDMTLTANYIRNCSDGTGIVSTGVTYQNINDFSAGFLVNTFVGPPDGEYTFSKAVCDVQLTFTVSF